MLMAFFVIPFLIYIILFIFKPQLRQFLSFYGIAAVVLIAFLALLYAVNSSPLWAEGERIVWAGVEAKSAEMIVGGNPEISSIGWANESFVPKVKAVLQGSQTVLEISGGAGFIRSEKSGEYLNGTEISAAESKQFGNYLFKKRETYVCGNYLQILEGDNLLVEIGLPSFKKDRVFNLDSIVEKATQNLTPGGDRGESWYCSTKSSLTPDERIKRIEALKVFAQDARLLIKKSGGIMFLDSVSNNTSACDNPCRIKVLWSNSSVLAEFDKSPKGNNLLLRFLPPYRNFSPLPKEAETKQLVVTNKVLPGDFAYTLPLGKQEGGKRYNLDLSQMEALDVTSIPEPFEKKVLAGCEKPSCQTVHGENLNYIFYRLKDLPSFWWLVIFTAIPVFLFLYGLGLIFPAGANQLHGTVAGVITAVWLFLMLRLLLAIRYALDPTYLDEHSINDITLAFAGLVFLPAFLFIVARLRDDAGRSLEGEEAARNIRRCLGYLLLIIPFFYLNIWYVQTLWTNLPHSFGFSLGWTYSLFIIAFFIYLFIYIFVFYLSKQEKVFNEEPKHFVQKTIRFLFLDIWEYPVKLVGVSQRFWQQILKGEAVFGRRVVAFGFIYLSFILVGFVLLYLGLKDFLPFFFCWIPVIFLLSAKTLSNVSEKLPFKIWAIIGVFSLLTILPFFLSPFAARDAGSIYANFAIIFSLALLLSKKAIGSRLFGGVSLALVGVGLILAFVLYLNFFAFIGLTRNFGEAVPRVLAYQRGDDFQHFILSSDAGSNENAVGLNVYDITNVYQHIWENRAIAHEGGFWGFGFGKAPVRLSQIRADTIQVDSVYSFFFVADYGQLGGFLLLLLYLAPLLLIYFGNRFQMGIGKSLTLLIAAAFCLEAFFHAGMNVGALPFTGRNLPLLAVHSFNGDFLRWTILFAFLISAFFWRLNSESTANNSFCLLTNNEVRNLDEDSAAQTVKPAATEKFIKKLEYYRRIIFTNNRETWRQLRFVLGFPLILLIATVFYNLFYVYRNTDLAVFEWKILKEDIDWAISEKVITVVPDESVPNRSCPKLQFDESKYNLKWKDDSGNDFLNQQKSRFNAMSCEERIGEGVFPNVISSLNRITDEAGYQSFLNKLRETDSPARRPRRPNLLAVQRVRQNQSDNPTGFIPVFNPDFNIRRSFKESQYKEEIPNIKIGANTKLVGTAWDKGKYIAALDNTDLLAWTDWMAVSLGSEWKRRSNEESAKLYGTLSLDEKLHKSALTFIDQKGISLHKETLAASNDQKEKSGQDVWKMKLPPRIGLTILRLSGGNDNGDVLALGGFPRAVAGNQWQKVPYGNDSLWLPPAKIIEKRFPPFLRQLYGGDRNFEKVSVMGSSTKPMFAEAVLSVHYGFNFQNSFKVSGTAVDDNNIFGIKITDKVENNWKGHGSSSSWVDFNTYLTESNNRYQVLFGFLGLAKTNQQNQIEVESNKGSNLVSWNDKTWTNVPGFDPQIGFGINNPNKMTNLHKTELALRLRRIFGVGTYQRESVADTNEYGNYMNSFWTKNENDDVLKQLDKEQFAPQPDAQIQKNLTPAILPARANFQLNKIDNPRDFVTLLLGGKENQWSNVHVAAGFASAVLGKVVIPHIVKNEVPPTTYGRPDAFVDLAKIIRPGLESVVFSANGTANSKLKAVKALDFLNSLREQGFQIYAKTGTLKEVGNDETTRLILVIVQFQDAEKKLIKKGLVFSIFAENTIEGTSATWLGEFLVQNQEDIRRLLNN